MKLTDKAILRMVSELPVCSAKSRSSGTRSSFLRITTPRKLLIYGLFQKGRVLAQDEVVICMVTTRPPKTIVKPTALGPVANTDTKLLIYELFQKARVLAQDGNQRRNHAGMVPADRRLIKFSARG